MSRTDTQQVSKIFFGHPNFLLVALGANAKRGEFTPKELDWDVSTSVATKQLDRLVALGMVERVGKDGRNVRYSRSDSLGWNMVETAHLAIECWLNRPVEDEATSFERGAVSMTAEQWKDRSQIILGEAGMQLCGSTRLMDLLLWTYFFDNDTFSTREMMRNITESVNKLAGVVELGMLKLEIVGPSKKRYWKRLPHPLWGIIEAMINFVASIDFDERSVLTLDRNQITKAELDEKWRLFDPYYAQHKSVYGGDLLAVTAADGETHYAEVRLCPLVRTVVTRSGGVYTMAPTNVPVMRYTECGRRVQALCEDVGARSGCASCLVHSCRAGEYESGLHPRVSIFAEIGWTLSVASSADPHLPRNLSTLAFRRRHEEARALTALIQAHSGEFLGLLSQAREELRGGSE